MSTVTRSFLLLCCLFLCACSTQPSQEATDETPAELVSDGGSPDATAPDTSPQDGAAGDASTKDEANPPSRDKAIAQIDEFIAKQGVDKTKSDWRLGLSLPPKLTFSSGVQYVWVLQTNQGTMEITFLPEVAPMHVSSTLFLTRLGFYDSLTFHRVITGFMAQGGDPLGTGTGGPGYQYNGEYSSSVKHDKAGILSMANTGRPGTDGSQFFITFKATPWLDGKHTIFGELTKGMEILKKIEGMGSRSGKPSGIIRIVKATVEVRSN